MSLYAEPESAIEQVGAMITEDGNPAEPFAESAPAKVPPDGEQQPSEQQPGDSSQVVQPDTELASLREEQVAIVAERNSLQAERDRLESETAGLREQCERLTGEADTLRRERDRLIVAALEQMGAIDGEYLLDQFKREGVTDCKQIFKQSKSRYPQLFRRNLDGVRPAGGSREDNVPTELSFTDRLRLFDENPEGYRGRFGGIPSRT